MSRCTFANSSGDAGDSSRPQADSLELCLGRIPVASGLTPALSSKRAGLPNVPDTYRAGWRDVDPKLIARS